MTQASKLIDKRIAETKDWRGEVMAKLRAIINSADPNITEEWKWDTAVWTHQGMVCALGAFKEHVKVNFFKGAQLKDSKKLINAGLESKSHRAIDFKKGDRIDVAGLKALIKEAIALNKRT
ncbi:MAG: DUF1801 domain-containing protein [Actinomycetota bacterium]